MPTQLNRIIALIFAKVSGRGCKATSVRDDRTAPVAALKLIFLRLLVIQTIVLFAAAAANAAQMQASDGDSGDRFGSSVSVSGLSSLVGALLDDIDTSGREDRPYNQGSAYLFRNIAGATEVITEDVKLTSQEGTTQGGFGSSVALSGNIALVGVHHREVEGEPDQGAAYVFRDLDSAQGTKTENAILRASDGDFQSAFGWSVSLSGSMAVVGAPGGNVSGDYKGSAYLFKNLDRVSGTVMETAKLTASDGAEFDSFGARVAFARGMAVVGAVPNDRAKQGGAYLYRHLDSAAGILIEDAKLVPSDGSAGDGFGASIGLSGSVALVSGSKFGYLFRNMGVAVGTRTEDVKLLITPRYGEQGFSGAVSLSEDKALVGGDHEAYLYLHLDSAGGVITQDVTIYPLFAPGFHFFGSSVSLEGDQFVIGAPYGQVETKASGWAYSGSVSSVTTLDKGSTSEVITGGIGFISTTDWIVGDETSGNTVTLSFESLADIRAPGSHVAVGRQAGANNNVLAIDGFLKCREVYIGSTVGNTGNILQLLPFADFEATAFRLAPGNYLFLSREFMDIQELFAYLGETKLQVWSGSAWTTVDDQNYESLITQWYAYEDGYTRITTVPEPSSLFLLAAGSLFLRSGRRPDRLTKVCRHSL